MNRITLPFCIFVIFLAVFKLFVLVSLPEEFVNNVEYLEKGNLTRDFIEGLKMPIVNYQTWPREGGHLLVGICAVPFFLLLGKTSFAFHLLGVVFSIGAFIGWYYLFSRYFDRKTTYLMSLLYIFAPPHFTRFTVLTTATHNEINFFIILFAIQFFHILFSQREARRMSSFILLGLIGAIGAWFCYSFVIMVTTCLILWLIMDKGILRQRHFWIFFGILLIGMIPILRDVLLRQGIIQEMFFDSGIFTGNVDTSMAGRLTNMLFQDMPSAIGFQQSIVSLLYYSIVIVSFVVLAYGNRKIFAKIFRKNSGNNFMTTDSRPVIELFIFLFPVVYLTVYYVSNYSYEHIFMLPQENVF